MPILMLMLMLILTLVSITFVISLYCWPGGPAKDGGR